MTSTHAVANDCFLSRASEWSAPDGAAPTQAQMDIARLLFRAGDRHVTSAEIAAEALLRDMPYGFGEIDAAMRLFAETGWVRKLSLDTHEDVFDTNTSDHHHFFDLSTGQVTDIPKDVSFADLTVPPDGMEIVNIDVVVTVRPKATHPARA